MRSIKMMAAVCAAMTAFAVAGVAEAQVSTRTDQVFEQLTPEDLTWFMERAGHSVVEQADATRLELDTADGFKFAAVRSGCDDREKGRNCEGLNLIATWTVKDVADAKLETMVHQFNVSNPAAKVVIFEGAVMMERYVIMTGGVTLDMLQTELDVFLGLSSMLWDELDALNAL